MNKFKSYRNYVWMFHVKPLLRPIKEAYKWAIRRISRKQRLLALRTLANLPPDAAMDLSEDDAQLLRVMSNLLLPSRWITRNGRIDFTCPSLEDITLWQMIETRQVECEVIDTDKDERKDATETKNPFVLPTYVCYQSRQRKEERIPQPGLPHGPHRRAFQ